MNKEKKDFKDRIGFKIVEAIGESANLIEEAKRKEDKIRLQGQIDGLSLVQKFIRETYD